MAAQHLDAVPPEHLSGVGGGDRRDCRAHCGDRLCAARAAASIGALDGTHPVNVHSPPGSPYATSEVRARAAAPAWAATSGTVTYASAISGRRPSPHPGRRRPNRQHQLASRRPIAKTHPRRATAHCHLELASSNRVSSPLLGPTLSAHLRPPRAAQRPGDLPRPAHRSAVQRVLRVAGLSVPAVSCHVSSLASKVRIAPPGMRRAGLRRVAVLGGRVAPIGSDGTDQEAVARIEIGDLAAHLVHHAEGLMADGHVLARADTTADSVGVRGANQLSGGLNVGPGRGMGLSMKPTCPISFITNAFMTSSPRWPDRSGWSLRPEPGRRP